MRLRSLLYQFARLLGDINAVQRGPSAVARRYVRRVTYRHVSRMLRRLLR